MIRKTALLYSMTGALMIAAPAMAQEQPQDMATPPAPAEAPAQPQSLTLTPGSTVKSADGSELGKLVGAQNGANGQELTVRGADGAVRAVALNGIRQEGSDIVVNATLSDFNAAAPIAGEEPAADKADTMAPSEPDAEAAGEATADEPKV